MKFGLRSPISALFMLGFVGAAPIGCASGEEAPTEMDDTDQELSTGSLTSGGATSGSATSGGATSGGATSGSATSGSATSGSATSGSASGSSSSSSSSGGGGAGGGSGAGGGGGVGGGGGTADYSLTGFAAGDTGGGVVSESDTAHYKKVFTAAELAVALKKGSGVKVVEIMNDLALGWNELPASAQVSPFAIHNAALTHPVLKTTGVSKLTVDSFNGLTIFSANGARITHAGISVKRSSNVVIRNLEFDELWEWDEASKGNFDKNDWDYVTLEEDSKVWIDHCTFNKAYDGLVDSKKGTSDVTISWSTFKGDSGSADSWVTQQINALEANRPAYPMYDYLRSSAVGLSSSDIIAIAGPQKKGHLVGANALDETNAALSITIHHNYYKDIQDRMPRLRSGNAHAFNIVMDGAGAWAAKKKITAAMATAISSKGFHFDITSNGAISTESGAVLVEKSNIIDVVYPIRNNQTDPADPTYTGKISAVDTIYSLDGVSFQGGSDTSGSPLSPVPAAVKAFSWNGFSSLPYSYTADAPSTLVARLTAADGAGAGKLTWTKDNWLKTSP